MPLQVIASPPEADSSGGRRGNPIFHEIASPSARNDIKLRLGSLRAKRGNLVLRVLQEPLKK